METANCRSSRFGHTVVKMNNNGSKTVPRCAQQPLASKKSSFGRMYDHRITCHNLLMVLYIHRYAQVVCRTGHSYTILFTRVPMPPVIEHLTSSPSLTHTTGDRPMPTPGGVPVRIRVPAGSVEPCERCTTTLDMSASCTFGKG